MEKEQHQQNKHLTYEERGFIEIGLNQGRTFIDISNDINKNRRTVSREILKHRIKKLPSSFNNSNKYLCKNRGECSKYDCDNKTLCYEEDICFKLTGAPYVCNGCEKKNSCRSIKYYYYGKYAHCEYENSLTVARAGISLSKSEAYEIDKLVAPLIKEKKQSINHIYANHPDELFFSKQTFYTYVNAGVFSFSNIDLPRKVKYKPRKNTSKQKIRRETAIRKDRTYEDFNNYIEKNTDASIVEMDTVEGIKGGKVFLTLFFRKSKFMLIYLLEKQTMKCVEEVFDNIKETLGEDVYKKVFEVILTDNGSEFFNPLSIEFSKETGETISKIFYCNPYSSFQKGAIEKNHEYIRYVLPKGSSFNNLIQKDVYILASNINSTNRESLNNNTPYEAVQLLIDEQLINKLQIQKIKGDDVNLSPKLLKKGDK